MRTILAIFAATILLTGCEKGKNKQWDANAMVSLRGKSNPSAVISKVEGDRQTRLTPVQVVEQATDMWFWNRAITEDNALGRGFSAGQRDIVNVRLLMFGTDIINQSGEYVSEFIESEDVILTINLDPGMDTIGYIPNSILRTAQPLIKAAFESGNYETCYSLFDQAFTFQPITGAEWRALKAKGEN